MHLAARRPRRPAHRLAAVAAALLVAAGCTTPQPKAGGQVAAPAGATAPPSAAAGAPPTAGAMPRYLEGRPLAGPTGLRLLVASDPPRLVDVDRGTSRRVGGLPAGQDPFDVSPLGDDGAIVAADRRVFVLDRRSARATPVGWGTDAAASADGRGVWLLEQGHPCRLREVALDGRDRRPARRVPCTTGPLAETPAGLLVWDEPAGDDGQAALLDPGTGRVRDRYPEVHGVVGDLVLWGGPEGDAGPFTLIDRRTGLRHQVRRLTPDGQAGLGRASPHGRLLAVEFVDPSWTRVKGQMSDIWLLDLQTPRWRRLPGMPLITGVKFMSMAWTGDGRLVLAGDFDRFGKALAIWRPGQDHLAVKRLALPAYAGSDTFVPWPAPA
jgi:hypothetical protein